MKDIVSACLVGKKCRYDGGSCTEESLKKRYDAGGLLAVCPECLAGLPAPRSPYEIVGGDGNDVLCGKARVVSKDAADVTYEFVEGAKIALEAAKKA